MKKLCDALKQIAYKALFAVVFPGEYDWADRSCWPRWRYRLYKFLTTNIRQVQR